MRKIAIVNQRYGLEVNGGSEYYTRMISERLKNIYEVEVITSKARDYNTWSNYYLSNLETINGVKVRRFTVKGTRGIRFRIVNKIISFMKNPPLLLERIWVKEQGPYCPELIQYLQDNVECYDAVIFVTYLYYPTVAAVPKLCGKAILVPTAHDEPCINFKIYDDIFTKIKGIIYLTEEEKKFVNKRFHNEFVPSYVAGVGIDLPTSIDNDRFKKKYKIYDDYFIYVGRVDSSKHCDEMFTFFKAFKKEEKGKCKLVVLGRVSMEIIPDPDIIVLGFVDEQDKYDAISGARALILPSEFESLSIAVLESFALSRPVIVNARCEVLKGHCNKSKAGVFYYGEKDFIESLKLMSQNSESYEYMCVNARKYIDNNYLWDDIINCYCRLIESVINNLEK